LSIATAIQPALSGFLAWQNENELALQGIGKVAALMNDSLTSSFSGMAKILGEVDSDILRSLNHVDWANLRFDTERNSIIYGDEVFSIDELNEDIAAIDAAPVDEVEKLTAKERFDKLALRFWIVIAIFQLLSFVPDAAEKLEWYRDNIPKLIERLVANDNAYTNNMHEYVYVIKERAVLREEPSSKSTKVYQLLYDSQLRVISTIQRWLEVEYNTDSGETVHGWISKISIEYEDSELIPTAKITPSSTPIIQINTEDVTDGFEETTTTQNQPRENDL
jgi:hypothetical protein